MKLEQLEIHRLPGISEAFTVRFNPDRINVITGANASGKSSLVRAVGALLYTGRASGAVSLAARWVDGAGVWTVSRTGGDVAWQFNGDAATRPPLPEESDFDAFNLSLENLAGFSRSDQAMARQLRRELAGGFDLDLLLEGEHFALPPRPMKMQQELSAVREQIQETEAEYERLDSDLRTLPELEGQAEEARAAGQRLEAVQTAVDLLGVLAEQRACLAGLEADFPPDMDRLQGEENRRLDELEEELAAARDRLKTRQQRQAQLEKELATLGMAKPGKLSALCRTLRAHRSELARAEHRVDEIGERLGRARAELEQAAARLDDPDPAAASRLSAEAIGRIGEAVENLLETRIGIRELEVRIGDHPVPDDDLRAEAERLGAARQALLAWLRTPGAAGPGRGVWGALAATTLGVVLIAAIELSWMPLLALLPLGFVAWLLHLHRRPDAALMVTRQFEQAGLDLPRSWNEGGVRRRLDEVESRLEAIRTALGLEGEHRRLARLRQRYEEQAGDLGKFAAGAGFSPSDRQDAGLIAWCRHMLEWQDRSDRVRGEERSLELARENTKRLLSGIREQISASGETPPEPLTAASLEAWINALEERVGAAMRMQADKKQLAESLADIRDRLARIEEERRRLLERAGLAADQADELRRRIDRLAEWRARRERLGELNMETRRLRERLQAEPELLDMVAAGAEQALARKGERLAVQAARREDLLRRVQDVQTRREMVLGQRTLEPLNARLETLRQELREQLDTRLKAIAGRVLVNDVREHFEKESQSETLEQARERFARFTLGQFTLEFRTGEDEPFAARSSLDGGLRRLSELSTGTRMQLLLAVRLAWISRAEQGRTSLPLFLDEVLTTADPDRFRAAVDAVAELVREGRQVFYIAAQDDDARAWQEWSGEDASPELIDLGDVRREQQFRLETRMPHAPAGQVREIPDPEGMLPAEWAREAGVPAILPWSDPGRIHVYYLLNDDLRLAARLMQLGIEDLGALDTLLEHGIRLDNGLDEDRRAQLRTRIRAVRPFIELWRQGRGRPLAPEDLEECPAISERFIDRARGLARACRGDGAEFLARVSAGELRYFREESKAELGEWLAAGGYIDQTPRPDRAGILARVCAASGLDLEQARALVDAVRAGIANGGVSAAQS